MLPTCHFYCLGYDARNSYCGLDNFDIASFCALISQSHALQPSDLAFIEHYCVHAFLEDRDELSTLSPQWFADTRRLRRFATSLSDAPPELLELTYYVVGAVDMPRSDTVILPDARFVVSQAQHLGFQDHNSLSIFLGYDLVEPHSFWSVLKHAAEWGSELFHGNQYGLCTGLDDVQRWLQRYGRSNDAFRLPADENRIVALYQLAEV